MLLASRECNGQGAAEPPIITGQLPTMSKFSVPRLSNPSLEEQVLSLGKMLILSYQDENELFL